jgi:hypothetical protein
MAIYQLTANDINTISRTTFYEIGLKEREDFQPLLKLQIEIISPDKLVGSKEFCEFDESHKRIDFLAIGKQANFVFIDLNITEYGSH